MRVLGIASPSGPALFEPGAKGGKVTRKQED